MDLLKVSGISDKRLKDLNKIGITTCENLIKHFPRNYLDLSVVQDVESCYNCEMMLILARVTSLPTQRTSVKRVNFVKVVLSSGGKFFTAIWFNQPYVLNKLKFDTEYLFYGRVKNEFGQITITNPTFEPLDKNYRLHGYVPVYKVGGLSQGVMSMIIKNAIRANPPKTIIPYALEKKYCLMPLLEAYKKVHFPNCANDVKNASERIALEEYFALMSSFKLIKGGREKVRQNVYDNVCADDIKAFAKRFGFELTNGQKQAINEIFYDLKSPHIMNRLVQGDVGSGKTAVAFCAMSVALKCGYQVAFMCPTEILAIQNYNLVKKIFPEFESVVLTSSVKAKEKREIKSKIASGQAQIIVGTHAIIQEDVEFNNLSLCVCDEQQRFGVAHRNSLSTKGNGCDVLVMSATPIPRSYSLVLYGDLDVSVILDKPKERGELKTYIVPSEKYDGMIEFVKKEISSGKQVYFVCPKIEDDQEGELMSVTSLYQELSNKLHGISLGLLHGKLKDDEKNALMTAFKNNEISALVSTTVIEVGIDVPNATVMVIINAERFGLSQLHQLRGRVGRGDKTSYCYLYTTATNEDSLQRLKVLRDNKEGFKISEYDFQMRGGGDFLGTRQSGALFKELGNLNYSVETLFFAKKLSEEAFECCTLQELEDIKKISQEKYYRIKDVTLN